MSQKIKLSTTQFRLLDDISRGYKLVDHPSVGSFSRGGVRWDLSNPRPRKRSPNRTTVKILQEWGLLSKAQWKMGDYSAKPLILTPKGKRYIKDQVG